MRKMRYLLTILVASVALMGVGFAWWSDTISVTGEMTTGNLDVQWSCTPTVTAGGLPTPATAKGVRVDENNITLTVEKFFPGAEASLMMHAVNIGNIPAKFDKATIVFTQTASPLIDAVKAHGDYTWDGTFGYIGSSKNPDALRNIATAITTALQGKILNPGESLGLNLPRIWMDEESKDNTQGQVLDFTLVFHWTQFNDPLTP